MDSTLIATLIGGVLGGVGFWAFVSEVMKRRKTNAEAVSIEVSTEGARVDRTLAVLESVLEGVKKEVADQRALREADRKEFINEVTTWRERSAKCDEALAAEIRAREHEKILSRERDTELVDVRRELTLAISDVARLTRRAEEEDRRARDVVAASAASDLLKNAGIPNGGLKASVDRLHDEVAAVRTEVGAVGDEVRTGNALTLGQKADADESRRVGAIPEADRTAAERTHLKDVPEP